MAGKKATKGLPKRTHKRAKAGKYAKYADNTLAKKARNIARRNGSGALQMWRDKQFNERHVK